MDGAIRAVAVGGGMLMPVAPATATIRSRSTRIASVRLPRRRLTDVDPWSGNEIISW